MQWNRSLVAVLVSIVFALAPASPAQAASKKVPLLVIGLEFPLTQANSKCAQAGRTTFPANITQTQTDAHGTRRVFTNAVDDVFFGKTNSVSDYYKENSYGQMELENAGVFGPYPAIADADHYWRAKSKCKHGSGWTSGHAEKRTEAVNRFIAEEIVKRKAFDLAKYDKPPYGNNDGTVTRDELVVLVAYPQASTYGVARGITPAEDSKGSFTVKQGSKTIQWNIYGNGDGAILMYTASFTGNRDLGLAAHELAHVFIAATDLYENKNTLPKTQGYDPTAPGPYSLMDIDGYHSHFDPLHKIDKGKWLKPIEVKKDGYYNVREVEKFPDVYKLADPNSHSGEYFLVENRQRTGYDNLLPDADGGLTIWHIDETRSNWRQRIELEPACGVTKPVQWGQYLWSAYVPSGGAKDFWDNSQSSNSRWHDGKKSRIGVFAIPASSSTMRVYFDVPGPGVLVSSPPKLDVWDGGAGGSFNVRVLNTGPSQDTFRVTFSGINPKWLKIAQALPKGVKQTWVSDDEALFTLGSYEGARFNVYVAPPKCSGESTQMVTVTAKSTTAPGVSGSDHTQVVVKIPGQTPTADKYEPNDSFDTATPVKLGSTQTLISAPALTATLHSTTDADYYRIEYKSTAKQEGNRNSGGGWGSFTRAFAPQYYPGSLSISVKEEYCRNMELSVYDSNRALHKTFLTAQSLSFVCPTKTFKDRKLFLRVRSPQKKRIYYKLSVAFNGWYITLKRPLTEPPLLKRPLPPWWKLFDPTTRYFDLRTLNADLERLVPLYNDYRVKLEAADRQYALARVTQLAGYDERAERLYINSITAFGKVDSRARQADALHSLGAMYAELGRQDAAMKNFQRAARLREILGDSAGQARDQLALSRRHLAAGDARQALATIEEALSAEKGKRPDRNVRLKGLLGQADAFFALKQREPAVACILLAKQLAAEGDDAESRRKVMERVDAAKAQMGEEVYRELERALRERAETVRLEAVSKARVK